MRRQRLAHPRYPLHIHLIDEVPVLFIGSIPTFPAGRPDNPRVVHQNVYAPELRYRLRAHSLDRQIVGHIQRQPDCPPAQRPDLRRDRPRVIADDVRHRYVRAIARQRKRYAPPYAAPASGHYRRLARNIHLRRLPVMLPSYAANIPSRIGTRYPTTSGGAVNEANAVNAPLFAPELRLNPFAHSESML